MIPPSEYNLTANSASHQLISKKNAVASFLAVLSFAIKLDFWAKIVYSVNEILQYNKFTNNPLNVLNKYHG